MDSDISNQNTQIILKLIDTLALALVEHDHVWTPEQRKMYEITVKLLERKL